MSEFAQQIVEEIQKDTLAGSAERALLAVGDSAGLTNAGLGQR